MTSKEVEKQQLTKKSTRLTTTELALDSTNEYDELLLKVNANSAWFYSLLIILNIPGFVYMMSYSVFLKQDVFVRCKIPPLEDKWTYEEIQHISQPQGIQYSKNCTCFDYDYKLLVNMTYTDAKKFLSSLPIPPLIKCKEFMYTLNHLTFHKEFDLYCNIHDSLEFVLLLSPPIGRLLAGLFFVFLGDVFGRKRLLNWGCNLFIIIGIVIPLSHTFEEVILWRSLEGFAYQCMETAIQAIILEVSNKNNQGYRFILMYYGWSVGFLISHGLTRVYVNWRYLQWAVSTPILLLPLVVWFTPESSLWYAENKEPSKAMALLTTINNPVKHAELLYMFRNDNIPYYQRFTENLKNFHTYAKNHLWYFILILIPIGCIHFKSWSVYMDLQTRWKIDNFLFGLASGISEAGVYMLSTCMLYLFNRKKSLLLTYMVIGVVYLLASFYKERKWERLVLIILVDIQTGVLNLIATLYACENTPITQRCGAIGITMAFGKFLPNIIIVIISSVIMPTQLMIAACCISFVGALFIIVAYIVIKDFHIDIFSRPHIQ